MQVDEEEFLQDCATGEHILQSKTAYGKNAAWRQQAKMLQHLTRDIERITIHSLDPTPNKPSYENEACFLQQPIAKVDSLFSGFSSQLKEPSRNQQQFAELEDVGLFFESDYRGRHRHVEMAEPKLQQLRDAEIGNDSVPSRRVGGASFAHRQHQQLSIKSRFSKKIVGGGDVPSTSNEKWDKLARAGAYV